MKKTSHLYLWRFLLCEFRICFRKKVSPSIVMQYIYFFALLLFVRSIDSIVVFWYNKYAD